MEQSWVCFFSRSGREIVEISKDLRRLPDVIVTNDRPDHLRKIHPEIQEMSRLVTIPNKPTIEDYLEVLAYFKNPLVTLHGWLRILPKEICNRYRILNGHPGLITSKSQGGHGDLLKGKDPIEKAVKLGLKNTGCVIHEVTAEVDEGKILAYEQFNIFQTSVEEIEEVARDRMLYLWTNLLSQWLDLNYTPGR